MTTAPHEAAGDALRSARELVDAKLASPTREGVDAAGAHMEVWRRWKGLGPGDHAEICALRLLLSNAESRVDSLTAERDGLRAALADLVENVAEDWNEPVLGGRMTTPLDCTANPAEIAALREDLAGHLWATQPRRRFPLASWTEMQERARADDPYGRSCAETVAGYRRRADGIVDGPLARYVGRVAARAQDRVASLIAERDRLRAVHGAAAYLADRYRAAWLGQPVRDLDEAEEGYRSASAALASPVSLAGGEQETPDA